MNWAESLPSQPPPCLCSCGSCMSSSRLFQHTDTSQFSTQIRVHRCLLKPLRHCLSFSFLFFLAFFPPPREAFRFGQCPMPWLLCSLACVCVCVSVSVCLCVCVLHMQELWWLLLLYIFDRTPLQICVRPLLSHTHIPRPAQHCQTPSGRFHAAVCALVFVCVCV